MEQLIELKTAQLAKQAAFDVKTKHLWCVNESGVSQILDTTKYDIHFSIEQYPCPSQAVLARWIRETHNIHCEVEVNYPHGNWISPTLITLQDMEFVSVNTGIYPTYEEALESNLQEALQYILNH